MIFYSETDVLNAPCGFIGLANVWCIAIGFSGLSISKNTSVITQS